MVRAALRGELRGSLPQGPLASPASVEVARTASRTSLYWIGPSCDWLAGKATGRSIRSLCLHGAARKRCSARPGRFLRCFRNELVPAALPSFPSPWWLWEERPRSPGPRGGSGDRRWRGLPPARSGGASRALVTDPHQRRVAARPWRHPRERSQRLEAPRGTWKGVILTTVHKGVTAHGRQSPPDP